MRLAVGPTSREMVVILNPAKPVCSCPTGFLFLVSTLGDRLFSGSTRAERSLQRGKRRRSPGRRVREDRGK
jgi:hypothetical protein